MALATDKTAVITENLADVGLNKKEIAECLKILDKQDFSALDLLRNKKRCDIIKI
ncbi:MAG: hypothetical protein K2H66_04205 [Oscillospiraceae bacterium]|nr:hypothetical protein [Oscillospiraceae bacterium]